MNASRIVQPDSDDDQKRLRNCKGEACSAISIRANFHPRQNTVASYSVRNGGAETVDIQITWGDIVGGCGTSSREVIFPGEIIEVFTPHTGILGHCRITAKYQSKEEKDEDLVHINAQCHFGGNVFNDGDIACINDLDHRCRNGRWVRLGTNDSCK